MVVLAVSLVVGAALQRLFEGVFGVGRTMRPMEIFLYEWWPLLRERNLYRHLVTAEVVVRPLA